MKFSRSIFCILFIYLGLLLSANDFTPAVTQFNKKDYIGGNQNWDVAQSQEGLMYFGNHLGLMRFDGSNFQLFKLPGVQTVRSVYIDKNDRIYVGAFREFGYFEKDKFGVLNYTSLANLLENYKLGNDEIWKIIEFEGKTLFQSFKSIFIFDGKTVSGKSFDVTFLYLYPFNNQIFAHTLENGFCRFDIDKLEFSTVENVPFKSDVISVVPLSRDEAYVITGSDGIYIFDGMNFRKFSDSSLDYLKNAGVNKAVLTQDSLLVIGTILDGITAVDKTGKRIWKLNTTNNLQNNTVLGMLSDSENNLWLALDKGISMVRLNKSIQLIQSFSPSIGSIYSLSFLPPDNLYLATNQGLYSGKFSLSSRSLTQVQIDPQIKGQVWTLDRFDNQLFCGNNEETYQIIPNRKIVSRSKGGMCMSQGIIHGHEVLVQGTYSDLVLYLKDGNEWKFNSTIQNFLNPIKTVSVDYQGRIWVTHMHQGMFMIKLNPDLTTIDQVKEYKSLDDKNPTLIYTYTINNRVVFTDNNRFYVYDDIKNKIVPYIELNKALGKYCNAYKVVRQKSSVYWFIKNEEAVLVEFKGDKINILDHVQYSLFLNQIVDNFQNIIPIANNLALFTLENGLALYIFNEKTETYNSVKREVLLSEVSVVDKKSEEKTLLPTVSNSEIISFPHTKNRIKFTISYPEYSNLNDVMFRYKLTGLNDNWSEKTMNNLKEYSYLTPGKYTFSVQVLHKNGKVLANTDYAFTMKPPFYWNTFSKIFYLLLVLLAAYLIYYFVKLNFEARQQKLHQEQEDLRKKEIEKREQEIIALKAEKLEADLTLKSKELAMSTMTIIRKNEVLIKVKEELVELKKRLGTQFPNKYYDQIIRIVDQNISSDDDWKIFQTNFDRIHENFFRNLHTSYPKLTSNDLRFCAYFRLNLTTKDIAHLMNISPKGVEVARYRIRKKINIPSEKNINEFLIEFK
ncbi:MAG: hypothetical protein GX361_09705 [Bacteroidales bacterium]|nr:hypothetical protein [Bacteroidales bacterium]